MILFDQHIYWGNCTGNYITLLAIIFALTGVFFYSAYAMRHASSEYIRDRAPAMLVFALTWVAFMIYAEAVDYFPPEIVRIVAQDGTLDVTWCHRTVEQRQQYALADVQIRYELERRGLRGRHHTLVLTSRSNANPIGRVEMIPGQVDLTTLGRLAPRALQTYLDVRNGIARR